MTDTPVQAKTPTLTVASLTAKPKKASAKKSSKKTTPSSARKTAVKGGDVFAAYAFKPFTNANTNISMEKIMTQGKTQFDKLAQEAANTGKQQVEAIMEFANIWTKGVEDIMKTQMALAQDMTERNTEAFKTLLGCKTINELTETQNRLAQESFDELMSGATKLSELTVKVATEAFEPINDHVSKSIKKATEALAA